MRLAPAACGAKKKGWGPAADGLVRAPQLAAVGRHYAPRHTSIFGLTFEHAPWIGGKMCAHLPGEMSPWLL